MRGIKVLCMAYQLIGDKAYAGKAREMLLAYAGKYESYKLHTIRGEARTGGGKIGPQTLDESTWLIEAVEGADAIWETLSEDERRTIADKLLYPATKVIRDHKMGIHNIQCWKNSAVGLTGLLLGDKALIEEALNGPSGYVNQMAKGVSPEGAWYEGAWGYHFYTVSAVTHLTEGALHSGINLYGPDFKRMFDAPVLLAMPDLNLPAFNDSGTVNVGGQARLFEVAFARYKEDRYRPLLAQSKRNDDYALLYGEPDVSPKGPQLVECGNYPGTGYAVLAAGKGREATWLCIKYGPHGGGHGHPDKLNFVMYARGAILAPDPGTTSYGVPLQKQWYRATLAHNTLVVDEEPQKEAEGKCLAFITADGFSAVQANAGKIHPEVDFTRTVALIGEDLLIFVDQIRAKKEHTLDLAYHHAGKFVEGATGESLKLPDKPGYAPLRDAKSARGKDGFTALFETGETGQARYALAGGTETEFITATGIGKHAEDRVPVVIARRKTSETVYIWAVALGKPPAALKVAALEGATPDAAVARVTHGSATWLVAANPAGKSVNANGAQTAAKIALFSEQAGKAVLRQEAK